MILSWKPDAATLAAAVRRRDISAVELAQTALARISTLDTTLHAFCTLTPELALREAAAVDRAMKWLRDAGALCELMPFRRAYHTPMCADVSRRVLEFLETVEVVPPAIPVYSCVTAQPYPADPGELRGVAAGLWSRRVVDKSTYSRGTPMHLWQSTAIGPRVT